jgi:hypothetical protein
LRNSNEETWKRISKFNDNFEFEFLTLSGNIPIIFVKNIFKYPEEMYEFLSRQDFWPTNIHTEGVSARPGLSHKFDPLLWDFLCLEFKEKLCRLFGVNQMKIICMYTTIMYANMKMDPSGMARYPHSDIGYVDAPEQWPVCAANFNLSKSEDPVVTGFWSWKGKTSTIDLSLAARNEYQRLPYTYPICNRWTQIEDLGDLKLESKVKMPYNSMVIYPASFLHNPYMKEDWFQDTERFMFSIFPMFHPTDLISIDDHSIKSIWKFFRLDDLWNFDFDNPKASGFVP